MLFGEITHSTLGTQLDCKGNHYMSTNNFIVDKSKPKYCLALAKPTCATKNIGILFDNACQELQNVYQQLTMSEQANQFAHTDWTKSTSSTGRGPRDLILVYFGPIYNVPPTTEATSSSSVPIGTKRTLVDEDDDDTDGKATKPNTEVKSTPSTILSTTSNQTRDELTIPTEEEISVGAFYDPRLLPDYGGNLFHHQAAKLVQHDVRDIDLRLIPPWNYYDKLRAGTMVLCDVTMHMYQMAIPNARADQPKVRKTFKLNAQSIRVVAKSNLPMEIRRQPELPTAAFTYTTTHSDNQDLGGPSTEPFALFNVVHKDPSSRPPKQAQGTQPRAYMPQVMDSAPSTSKQCEMKLTEATASKNKQEEATTASEVKAEEHASMEIDWPVSDADRPDEKANATLQTETAPRKSKRQKKAEAATT
ncbi:hypothetical protein M378DRAFT_181766 [Amanita muscaria Koide BX008]|uniref:Uncharacterized protein n=1 Tax=Amanita muscaria (strain Koide BX008) TaxID=946122 RepID=A0A0C2WLI3_AMAMK|nr:hypothetical protein M378DRAFT_181766 [Amanita muscaria Koide BX008]